MAVHVFWSFRSVGVKVLFRSAFGLGRSARHSCKSDGAANYSLLIRSLGQSVYNKQLVRSFVSLRRALCVLPWPALLCIQVQSIDEVNVQERP